MAEKSKEQLKVEEYFKHNGIEYDKNFIYAIIKRKKFEFIFDDGTYWIDYESRNEAVLYTF